MIYMWFTGINYYELAVEKDRDSIFTTICRVPKRIWSRRHFERSGRQCGAEGTIRLGVGIRGRFFVKILKFKPSEMAFPGIWQRPIFCQEKFPRTENFPKISLLKVENFQLQNLFPRPITFYKIFYLPKIFLSAWKWALRFWRSKKARNLSLDISASAGFYWEPCIWKPGYIVFFSAQFDWLLSSGYPCTIPLRTKQNGFPFSSGYRRTIFTKRRCVSANHKKSQRVLFYCSM